MILLCFVKRGPISSVIYEHVAVHRSKHPRARRDSGGLVLYYKTEMDNHISILKTTGDCLLCGKLSKTFLNIAKDLYFCLCYAAPVGSSRAKPSGNIFDQILTDLVDFDTEYQDSFIPFISGDLNARTNQLDDCPVVFDHIVDTDKRLIPDRVSEDTKPTNEHGVSLLEFCKQAAFVILNGRVGDDAGVGQYTCITANGSSVVDYVLCREEDFNSLHSFCVTPSTVYSDHCLVAFVIKIQNGNYKPTKESCNRRMKFKYQWDDEHKVHFLSNLNTEDMCLKFIDLFNEIDTAQMM